MKLKKELKELEHRAKDFLNIQSNSKPSSRQSISTSPSSGSGHSSRSAGSNSQKDVSSGLDCTDQDTKDLS